MNYNEYDESPVRKIQKKQRQKKKRKIRKRVFVLLLIIIVIGLILSPILKVKSINIICKDKEIKESVTELVQKYQNQYYWFLDKETMKEDILKELRLKDVTIQVSLIGDIDIQTDIAENLAYAQIDKTSYYCNSAGNVVTLSKDEEVNQMLPTCTGTLTLDVLKQFAQAYKDLPDLIRNDISDILFIPEKYDPLLIELRLNNKNIIHVRIDEMESLYKYFDYNAQMTQYKGGYIFRVEGKYVYFEKIK